MSAAAAVPSARELYCPAMRTLRALACAALTTALLVVPGPADARHATVVDEPGDTLDPGLDITRVSFRNRDHAVVVDFAFRRDRRGEIIVAMDSRGGPLMRMISQHPVSGPDKTFLIDRSGEEVPCRGLSSDWSRADATVRLRMPSRCLDGGDYGALRFWALIEGYRSSSSDVDYAPETPDGDLTFTDWVPRG